MSNVSYLVLRLVPDAPVDAGTFDSYLDGLQIQVFPADGPTTGTPLGQIPPPGTTTQFFPITLLPFAEPGAYVAFISTVTTSGTPYDNTHGNYGTTLEVESVDGIIFGAVVSNPSNSTTNYFPSNDPVTSITESTSTTTPSTVGVKDKITNFIPAGTVVTFAYFYNPGDITLAADNGSFSLQIKTSGAVGPTATIPMQSTNGIMIGMVASGTGIPVNATNPTTVTAVTATSVILSAAATVGNNAPVTFTCYLNTGIVQHVWELPIFGGLAGYFPIPQSVATAIIQISPAPANNSYLDIQLVVTRNNQPIPVKNEFYNVLVSSGSTLPVPFNYQTIPLQQTSLYLSLPAPPINSNSISLLLPADGTAPPFDLLVTAMQAAMTDDPFFASSTPPANINALSIAQATRMAYDIVWSQQTPLPLPPDPLETLYTNPPNTGGVGGGSSNNNGDEQDRQKFEGTLNSFYSTRNADAVRLTKFVAAASAALANEQQSGAAPQALLEFPVDPTAKSNPSPVESEVLLNGLPLAGINFGVPAAFFYALGTKMDKSATAAQRYQIACGDAVQRVLQEFGQAVNEGTIGDSEYYFYPPPGNPLVNSAQAARRLSALSVTNASTSPIVALPATGPLFDLVQAWLAYPPTPTGSAPPTYQSYQPTDDNDNWAALVVSPSTVTPPIVTPAIQTGFLQLVLGAMTQGYIILPADPLASEIYTWLQSISGSANPTVDDLKNVTAAQWNTFFTTKPPAANPLSWFPPFAQPGSSAGPTTTTNTGYINTCIKAFVRAVQKFFTVSSVPNALAGLNPGAPPSFGLPPFDAIGDAVGSTITFGQGPLTAAEIATAVTGVFSPGTNAEAQAWLAQAIATINELCLIAKAVPNFPMTPNLPPTLPQPPPVSLEFSIMEALYARGFRSAKDITRLSPADFQQALIGTVAYSYAVTTSGASLYQAATNIAHPPATSAPTNGGFKPVNPDGTLTNCVPHPCFSPFGPIAYLQEMLEVSESSTCENPLTPFITLATTADAPPGSTTLSFASTAGVAAGASVSGANIPGGTTVQPGAANTFTLSQTLTVDVPIGSNVSFAAANTLGAAIAQRRGPLADLAATCANCETPLPLIDIVNECLEFLGTEPTSPSGTVYNTSAEALAGHKLCKDECCEGDKKESTPPCHKPAALFAALPEYSTPATPVAANSPVEPSVFDQLEVDFSSCCLPYSQPADVSRTYLRHFGTCRYEVMRTFRRCITEFVLDPANEPAGFEDCLWRYPVRVDTAIEYLGITPEEYVLLFNGTWPNPCGGKDGKEGPVYRDGGNGAMPWQLYGFATADVGRTTWTEVATQLPAFLASTCLTYCEFLELWKSGYVPFSNGGDATYVRKGDAVAFPECEPCCLEKFSLQFPQSREGVSLQYPDSGNDSSPQQSLYQLAIFIRLWRKLKDLCGAGYSFDQLRDICDVLQLFNGNTLNPDFIRQLAAFQMLRDHFHLSLVDPADKPAPGAIDADRTHLLALWVGAGAAKWNWAVQQMLEKIAQYAQCRHKCERRPAEFVKVLASHLDSLSQLAGFNPTVGSATVPPTDDRWQAVPTHTLRFAEVLSKIYASNFHLDEIFYLFNAGKPWEGEAPFPLQEENEAIDSPLSLPHDEHEFSLWKLRRQLLEAHVAEEDFGRWSWIGIEAALRDDFGFAASDLLVFGQHFFPATLQSAGYLVDAAHRRYSVNLATTNQTWNTPPGGPFQYDAGSTTLWMQLPLPDEAVIGQLERLQQLTGPEQQAVQDLYYQPRNTLAAFAFLFTDFVAAQQHLIEEREEHERWNYFRRHFALCHARCRILAEHLARHVDFATGQPCLEGAQAALLVLRGLLADENYAATSWESNSGQPPNVTWKPPGGGAFAALLGLTGTGLLREYTPAGGAVAWRDVCGPLSGFGEKLDRKNCPVPAVLPSLVFAPSPAPPNTVSIRNGLAVDNASGNWLGGAQGFTTKWTGALLIEKDGRYEFCAGAPTPECQAPEVEMAGQHQWRVTLKRGSKTWLLINHHWQGETGTTVPCLSLRRGAYNLCVEFMEPSPTFAGGKLNRQHTGIQVKYTGPDTHERLVEIPHHHLFRVKKEMNQVTAEDGKTPMWQDLGYGITGLAPNAANFLNGYYTSSLRDIRRTYQRAFKALLLVHRYGLSAGRNANGHSELGYLLAHFKKFAGQAFYRGPSSGTSPGAFNSHAADFDFNFLPLLDDYYAPTAAQDSRVQPSEQRCQALFDWWERLFDYDRMRRELSSQGDYHVWRLFQEAEELQPANPGSLLRHIGADPRHWQIDLRYYQNQNTAVYPVTSSDLTDDRWVVRAWHADRWLTALQRSFTVKDIAQARPDLWASLAPDNLVTGETQTGNGNLSAFLCAGCLENGQPPRYEEVKRLNDGLRERGRRALLAYLCRMNRVALPWGTGLFATVPGELSAVLLLDVETGLCEKASRIEEAITAVQNFVRRARLGLEAGWTVTRDFALLWDKRFATFRIWEACKRRELYKENWVDWEEMEKARRIEAFRFLEDKLRSATLTIAEAGGGDWWPDQCPPPHRTVRPLQVNVPSSIQQLPAAPPTPEGWNLLGTPENNARPSWLTPAPSTASASSAQPSAAEAPTALAAKAAQSALPSNLPFWLESAVRLGKQLIRVAAAGWPAASAEWVPHRDHQHAGCCAECGCVHPPMVDEYYFWLIDAQEYGLPDNTGSLQFGVQDSYYDQTQQQSVQWNDSTNLPQLLIWPATPAVRLAWCRVHNGEFSQPRRSVECVEIQAAAGLQFLGRAGDSLYFSIQGAVPAPDGVTDNLLPGFRYDLPWDEAVAIPLATPAATSTSPAPPGGLPAYPFFAFDTPGAPLFPNCLFAPAVVVADALRIRCRFDLALKWYELTFAPLQQDCTWVDCPATATPGVNSTTSNSPVGEVALASAPASASGTQPPAGAVGVAGANVNAAPTQPVAGSLAPTQGACCDSTDVTEEVVRNRAVTLHYCQTLLEWGDHVMRHRPAPEAFQQARLIFDTIAMILGKCPRTILLKEPAAAQSVACFKPAIPGLNPRLLEIYHHTADRLGLIHACMNARRFPAGRLNCELPYFGDNPLREGWRTAIEGCVEETEWCLPHSPYRFMFLIQKARELASGVREFGSLLLAAYEKGDAEYLASIRAGQEREMHELGIAVRQNQWRDADWQIQALQQTKELNQTNLIYYSNLYQNGLINDETQHEILATTAMQTRTSANTTEAVGEAMKVIPDLFLSMDPESQIPIGTKLAGVFETIGRVMMIFADIQSETAALDLTLAGWQRRSDEWLHQTQTLPIEIQQIEMQILGAQRRRAQALHELNNQQRQFEQATEVLNFLRDKFTADKLYLWMQKETCALHHKMHELALHAARQAERAFNLERGHTTRRFIPECTWDTLHEGLLAGERLEFALHQMEKAYLDLNVREYELTKHFSLRLHFPMEFLRLKITGRCEIELPEWMFDLDYPGHYMRRIKNVTMTIPCVAGPYNGVHCRLTLFSSRTRIDPGLIAPTARCCDECKTDSCYEACPHDPRAVRQYAAREAIATSSGQNDSGLFELNFRDDRYLPFEYHGAVSRWRIELPLENNYFDRDTLSDVILHLNHTAREGGELLRQAATKTAEKHLPGSGWTLFDVRHEFPDAWELFRTAGRDNHREKRLNLHLTRNLFPFIPGHREVWVDKIILLFETPNRPASECCKGQECACPEHKMVSGHKVKFALVKDFQECDGRGDETEVCCVASEDWPELYGGALEKRLGPLVGNSHRYEARFQFSNELSEVSRVFVFCHYAVKAPSVCDPVHKEHPQKPVQRR